MKVFVEGATKAQAYEHAQAVIDGEKEKGIIIALVKIVRLAKGVLLFFDRSEFEEWAKDKKVSKGIYKGKEAG